MRRARLCLLSLLFASCHRHPEGPAQAKNENATPVQWSTPALANQAAFDLTLANQGALLVWSAPTSAGGGITVRSLDARGAPLGEHALAKASPGGEVVELVAAFGKNGVGLAWIESSASTSQVRSLRLEADARAGPQPVQLASTSAASPPGRGRLAIASDDDGRLRILYPTGPSECIETSVGPCTGFGFRELGNAPPGRQEPWLSVPQPCTTGAAALGGLPGHWFYALCSWTGEAPATTAYTIQMEPSYARADQVLEGCTPLGMTRIDAHTLLLVGDCGPVRRAARLGLNPIRPAELALEAPEVQCTESGAAVVGNGWALALDAPRDRVETVLPPALAPAGSRAVFTGQALLVAEPTAAGLALRVHTCADGSLRSR